MDTIFFDSWGNPWITCGPEHPDAHAFGPAGCARVATWTEHNLSLVGSETAWACAKRLGRLVRAEECHEWDTLGAASDPRPGDPCPRCGEVLAAFSPSNRGTAACDGCDTVWGAL